MADSSDKSSLNIQGPFYSDNTCCDCDLCRETAPGIFRRDDTAGQTYVWRQPQTPEEFTLAEEAMTGCPTESIGNDG